MAARVGEVLSVDMYALGASGTSFVRVRVKLDVLKPLTILVGLHPEGHERLHFQVIYEKLPKFCAVCGLFGHGELECGDGLHTDTDKQYGEWMVAPMDDWHPHSSGVRSRGPTRESTCGGRGGGRGTGRDAESRKRPPGETPSNVSKEDNTDPGSGNHQITDGKEQHEANKGKEKELPLTMERREGANQYVGLWVRQTCDVAHEVEDVLDEFLRRLDLDTLQRGVPAWRRYLALATSCTTQVSVRHDLRGRMDGIKNRLKEISDNVDKYKIRKLRSATSGASSSAHNTINTVDAWDEVTELVGFETEREALKERLLEGDTSRSVISVVGESGIGKSTLAWEVYDSPIIRKEFDVRAWINVPPQIRDDDILYFIYKRVCPETDDHSSVTEKVHEALSLYLVDKRYLVMIDGLVNFTNWNSILQSLPQNKKGSRIMIITRLEDKEAAYTNPKIHPLKIGNLKRKDSKRMFQRRVFGVDNQFQEKIFGSRISQSEQLMDRACEDMLQITHGLPLAIVVLAGLLRTKSISEWDKVLKKLKSSDEPKQVKRILALSFDDLPSRLKSCFLYFAGMPENLIYNARRLVRLWAAEGFLKPKKGNTMEDIGQNYLKELISRGMIHLVKRDLNGGVWLVAIHDRLHAFAQAKAQEASFLKVHDSADLLAPGSVRRIYLQNYMKSYIPMGTSFPR
ncbi:hypothetical protein ACQ4PT_027880 [Festuca glaucescens]